MIRFRLEDIAALYDVFNDAAVNLTLASSKGAPWFLGKYGCRPVI
ncbi:hypothetical protein [Tateyamaria pelophila]|nr:hypothetical protein [Tateyamaria pelophila]